MSAQENSEFEKATEMNIEHKIEEVQNKESMDDKKTSELASDEIKEPNGVDTTILFEEINLQLDEITTFASVTMEEDGKARHVVIDHSPSNNDQTKTSVEAPTTSGNLIQNEEIQIITPTDRTHGGQVIPTTPEKCDMTMKVLQKEEEKQPTTTSETLNNKRIPCEEEEPPSKIACMNVGFIQTNSQRYSNDSQIPQIPAIYKDKTETADKIVTIIRGTETNFIIPTAPGNCEEERVPLTDGNNFEPYEKEEPPNKITYMDAGFKQTNSMRSKAADDCQSQMDKTVDDIKQCQTQGGENRIENSVPTCHSKKIRSNKNSANNAASAERINVGQAIQKETVSLQNRKEVKADSSNLRTRTGKSFAATGTRANVTAVFKKPAPPEKLPTAPTRSAVPTPALSAASYTYGGKMFKLRKLCVRVNRDVVPSYFKKIQEATKRKASKPVTDRKQSAPKATSGRVAKSKSDKSLKQKENCSVDKALVEMTKKRVSLKRNAALSSYGRPLVSGVMTIPPDRRRKPSLMAKEAHGIGGCTQKETKASNRTIKPSKPSGNKSRLKRFPLAQRKQVVTKETMRKKSNNQMQTQNEATNSTINEETALLLTPAEPKEEGEAQQLSLLSAGLSNTNSLALRTLAIAAATQSACSQICSDDTNVFSGLSPTSLDTNGTRLYSYLHPAKYNESHGCVLLDYCCPNLDGPMPAIDHTRIHGQVHAAVRELPAHLVMTTRSVTRADLHADITPIPSLIRQQMEMITADTYASNTGINSNVPSAPVVSNSTLIPPNTVPITALDALLKTIPSTTTITPKLVASSSVVAPSASLTTITPEVNSESQSSTMSVERQRQLLRNQLRQFDARLKQNYHNIAVLTFAERQRVIEGIVNSTTMSDTEVSYGVRVISEFISQVNQLTNSSPMSSGTRQVIGRNSSQEAAATNTQVGRRADQQTFDPKSTSK